MFGGNTSYWNSNTAGSTNTYLVYPYQQPTYGLTTYVIPAQESEDVPEKPEGPKEFAWLRERVREIEWFPDAA